MPTTFGGEPLKSILPMNNYNKFQI
ncbi:hypothetical protein [Staphylococcus aureus]